MSLLSPAHWEGVISAKLWENVSSYVFERIYLPAAQSNGAGTFNTQVDINLKHWADSALPAKAVDVGWEALREQFTLLMEKSKSVKDHDDIFDNLKSSVWEEAVKRHKWEEKASDVLRVIQLNALEDRAISDKQSWDSALRFLEDSLVNRLKQSKLMQMKRKAIYDRLLFCSGETASRAYWSGLHGAMVQLAVSGARAKDALVHQERTGQDSSKRQPTRARANVRQ